MSDKTYYLSERTAQAQMNRKPKCIIITGGPGSGKTTLARKLGERLCMPTDGEYVPGIDEIAKHIQQLV